MRGALAANPIGTFAMMLSALARGFSSSSPQRCPVPAAAPRGFTLIEILISLVVTLIMMGAVVTLFGVVTDSVSGSRALLETSDRLRAARNRLALDLQGATVTPIPPRRPENDEGYLEIVEGPDSDSDNNNLSAVDPPPTPKAFVSFSSLFGDCDDVLLLTTRSRGEPFIGKLAGVPVESQVAEVAYFLRQDGPAIGFYKSPSDSAKDNQPVRLYTLYRRCMLVRPSGGTTANFVIPTFYYANDISARADSSGAGAPGIANSLGDLTKPENRFGRLTPLAFPYKFNATLANRWKTKADGWDQRTVAQGGPAAAGQDGFDSASGRLGDDVILTNVLAFDVQVFDPGAPVYIDSGVAIEPRDSGYASRLGSGTPVSFGAYADLGYGFGRTYTPPSGFPTPSFNLGPASMSGYSTSGTPRPPFVYDTWSLHYEADGVVQESQVPTTPPSATNLPDAGLNGLDDDANGVVDDVGEMDTLPPYSAPLRGLRVTIRVYEPGSQQIRQVTVVQDFLQD
jgi:prepilin-type N-terminal cleavage/methylation domain-containing protein